jgi:Holliday junction resolvasome RuvABC DNA-binding subunit
MTIKFVSTDDTKKLHGLSYSDTVMVKCFHQLMPDSNIDTKYLSAGKQKKIENLLAEKYIILYCVESYQYPTQHYNDDDGDYIRSDSETTVYPIPNDELIQALVDMGYTAEKASTMLSAARKKSHYINLYYGESINLLSIAIPV